jgi:hypothetical protein
LFAVPAAVAGYHAVHGIAYVFVPIEGWRETMAIADAIMVGAIHSAAISFASRLARPAGLAAYDRDSGPIAVNCSQCNCERYCPVCWTDRL